MRLATELHVRVPDEVAASLASEAAERGLSAEDIAAEVLAGHSPAPVTATELAFFHRHGPQRPW